MRPIPLGAKGTFVLRVTPAHLANQFKDRDPAGSVCDPDDDHRDGERGAQRHGDFLDESESPVGTAVNIRHLAATPVGHDITAQA